MKNYIRYRNYLCRVLPIIADKKIIIYPFGSDALEFKNVLNNNFFVYEDICIDREISKVTNKVKNISFLENIDIDEYVVFFTRPKEILLNNLLAQGVKEYNIFNIFGDVKHTIFDLIQYLIRKYKVNSVFDADVFLEKNNQITMDFYFSLADNIYPLKCDFFSNNTNFSFPIYKKLYNYFDFKRDCCDVFLTFEKEKFVSIAKTKVIRAKYYVLISEQKIDFFSMDCIERRYSYIYYYVIGN